MQLTDLSGDRQRECARPAIPHPLFASSGAVARRLYIHIPFCTRKCRYCDFYSVVAGGAVRAGFVERLCGELLALAPFTAGLQTIFVGGGTPSLLDPAQWQVLLRCLAEHYDLSGLVEFTVECNPETITEPLVHVLRDGGVNRLSLGAQSFHTRSLEVLQRRHEPGSVQRGIELARRAGLSRLSLDLIFAIPGQTIEMWSDDLDRALEMPIDHLSCYNLTYEAGTPITALVKAGELEPIDEDIEIEMYLLAVEHLAAAELDRYEVSNFARPGCECQHNVAYWRGEAYLAAGPAASGHLAGHRWRNVPDLTAYLASTGLSPVIEHEAPDPRRELAERIMLGLRLCEGVDVLLTGHPAERVVAAERAGLLERQGTRIRLTDAGFLQADGIAADLMPMPDVPVSDPPKHD